MRGKSIRANAKTKGRVELEQNYEVTEWREFFKTHFEEGISMKEAVIRSGYNETAVYRYFSACQDYVDYKNSLTKGRNHEQYCRIVAAATRLGLKADFTEIEYRGMQREYPFICNDCGTRFLSKIQSTTYAPNLCSHCKHTEYRSKLERWLCEQLRDRGIKYTHNNRSVVRVERDIQIGNHAFELNGYYYHALDSKDSVSGKDKFYHRMKTEECLSKGIYLHHLWYTNFNDCNKELILSQILVNSGNATTVFARKLKIGILEGGAAKDFFNMYHIDGYVRGKNYALFDGVKPLCAININTRRLQATGEMQYEIGRFATIFNTVVVGGYSRLLKYTIGLLKQEGCKEIYSYCNRDISPDYTQTFYYKQGFEFLGDSGPTYCYYADRKIVLNGKEYSGVVSRQACQKSKLIDHYKANNLDLPEDSSEAGLALKLGLRRCYNSGNWKFVKRFD